MLEGKQEGYSLYSHLVDGVFEDGRRDVRDERFRRRPLHNFWRYWNISTLENYLTVLNITKRVFDEYYKEC